MPKIFALKITLGLSAKICQKSAKQPIGAVRNALPVRLAMRLLLQGTRRSPGRMARYLHFSPVALE